jgi:hypothetical protein
MSAASVRNRPIFQPRLPLASTALVGLRYHLNGATRAFSCTDAATLAVIVVDPKALSGTELNDSIIRANSVAVVALKAVPARQASACFEERIRFVQTLCDFCESALSRWAGEMIVGGLRARSFIGAARRELCEGSGPGGLVPSAEPFTTELPIISCAE